MKIKFYASPFFKVLSFITFALFPLLANAQFSGYYDPSSWIEANNPSSTGGFVDPSGAPASISIISGNNGDEGFTDYSIVIPANGTVTFSWSYSTTDGAEYDYPEYEIDGVSTILAGYNTNGANNQNGTASIPVTAGQVFALRMTTYDGQAGPGTTVFSNFTAPVAPSCAGAVGGTASVSLANVCPGQGTTLSLSGNTVGLGISFQWEESPTGTNTWTPISGATNYSYVLSGSAVTAATDYHAIVTCSNGGASDISTIVTVSLNPANVCYCSPFNGTTLHSNPYNYVDNVTIQGTTLNSSNPSIGVGGYLQLNPAIASNTASLEQGVAYVIENTMTYSGLTSEVWIDYDQNGVFDPSEFIPLSPSSGSNNISSAIFSVPISALPGTTGMRVRANYNPFSASQACYDPYYDGETEDYTITIVAAVACAGAPSGGTATAPANVCAGSPFMLMDNGNTTGLGIDLQWEESPTGAGTWTPIAGATNSFYNYPGINAVTDFRLSVTCNNGGAVDYSNVLTIGLNPFNACYCSPLTGTTLHNYGGYNYIDNVTIPSTTLNSSNTVSGPGGYLQVSAATPSNTADLTQGVSYTVNLTMTGSGYEPAMWIDYDQSGSFDPSEYVALSPSSGPYNISSAVFTVPVTATPGMLGMRVRAYYNNYGSGDACYDSGDGETEDYVVNIIATVPCGGTPAPGTASAPASVCENTPFDLSTNGSSVGPDIQIQWEESPTGAGTWTPIAGATDAYYIVPGITSSTDYHAVVTCINGGGSDVTADVSVTVSPFYLCYCSPLSNVILHSYSYDYVDNVTIPGTTLNSSNSNTPSNGFTQVPSTVPSNTADLLQGVSYPLEITMTDQGYIPGVWIDYDQNGIFDASEFISMGATNNNYVATGNFTVPVTAVLGTTGMRVRGNYNPFTDADACYDPGDGETEDYLVNISPAPSCIPPSALLPVSVLSTTADISWAASASNPANGYEWSVFLQGAGPSGTPVASGTTAAGVTVANISGLSATTDYSFYVRSICSPVDVSLWSVMNFTSACSSFMAPFTETFDNSSTPNCWSNTGPESWEFSDGPGPDYGVGGSTENTGNGGNFAWVDGSGSGNNQDITLNSPNIDISGLGTPQLRYYVKSFNVDDAANNKLVVQVLDAGVWVEIDSIQMNFPSSAWYERTASLAGLSSSIIQIRFVVDEDNSQGNAFYNDILIDDIYVEDVPTCPTPTALTVSNTTMVSADLGWTENGSATLWQVQYGMGTFALGTGTLDYTNTNPYGISGLAGSTDYSFFVRAVCGPNDTSAWSIRQAFATPPVNDPCADAIDISSTLGTPGTTAGATESMPAGSCAPTTTYANDVWYTFTTTQVGDVTVTAVTTVGDVVMEVLSGTCGSFTTLDCQDVPAIGTETSILTNLPIGTYYVRVYGFEGSQGPFTIQVTGTPLAITLNKLSATNVGQRNRVDWTTATEAKGDYFIVERSADGNNFSSLGEVKAKAQPSAYSFWDQTPVRGTNYYRLKLVDASGKNSYSRIVTATVKDANGFTIDAYPNPVNDQLTVTAYGQQGTSPMISICDVTGKVIRVVELSGASVTVNMSSMAQGAYLIKYSDSNHTETIKVNKQ